MGSRLISDAFGFEVCIAVKMNEPCLVNHPVSSMPYSDISLKVTQRPGSPQREEAE